MRISACDIEPFAAPLNRALPRTQTFERTGWYVTIQLEDDTVATGEIAPLEGFSVETSEEAMEQATKITPSLIGRDTKEDVLAHLALYPSVSCGFELALAKLSKTPPDWWGQDPPDDAIVCALLDPLSEAPSLASEVSSIRGRGTDRIKLKVGDASVAEDLVTINNICDLMGGNIKLRLDANRRWSIEEATSLLSELDPSIIEFVEDPLRDPRQLQALFDATGIPIALDESLEDFIAVATARFVPDWVSAVVLKPMLRRGYKESFKLAEVLSQDGVGVVVSSSFESPVGHDALLRFWASLPPPRLAAGLDTGKYFARTA